MRRSMLFIPGNTPNLLVNSPYLGADAIIFDLEDAVSPAEKDSARILVRNTLRYLDLGGRETMVRINAIDTDYWKKDVEEIVAQGPDILMLPKSSRPEDIQTADAYITQVEERVGGGRHGVRLMPLIETALGVENAFAIATASPRVTALFLGAEDLTADLRCQRTKEGQEIASLEIDEEVLDLSAAGEYLAVLYSDSLVIYDRELEESARLVGTDYAGQVIMESGGTALVITGTAAWRFLP